MGFYPKHLKVRRHRWNMRIIATASLSGCSFVRAMPIAPVSWFLRYPDGKENHVFARKAGAAAVYLMWWFDKQNMWPRYRA